MKQIPGFEGFYSVTETGQVYSHARIDARGHKRNGKFLKQIPDGDGYPRVHLCVNSQRRKWQVHRLVAMSFIPNPDSLPVVNHIDGDKTNNNVLNLEWVTVRDNFLHALKTGLMPTLPRNYLGQFQGN